jgi:arylsulfatase A-like enzyme
MERPNIVYVFPDEYRQQAVGFMGQDPVLTPNLDRLAREGVVFTNAVSNFPVCSPYRAMLLTGKYPFRNGVPSNCNTERSDSYLRPDEKTLSDTLKAAGYSLGYIGKWHLDYPEEETWPYTEGRRSDGRVWDSYTPPERRHGFDFWYAYGCCDRHLDPHYWTGDAPMEERIDPGEWSVKHETDIAVSYIRNEAGERNPAKPFALFVAYNPPHMPFDQVPEEYLRLYEEQTVDELLNRPNVCLEGRGESAARDVYGYFGAVSGIDDQFGRILKALDDEELSENTIVIFTSDHGEMMGSHGLMHKVVWYDESFLVPFIARWPARLRHRTDDLLIGVPDIFPTLLGMTGIPEMVPVGVQGKDLSGWVLDEQMDKTAVTRAAGNSSDSISTEGESRPEEVLYLSIPFHASAADRRGVRTDRYMYVVERIDGIENRYLYDYRDDPYQMNNLIGAKPEVERDLDSRLTRLLTETGDPWWSESCRFGG